MGLKILIYIFSFLTLAQQQNYEKLIKDYEKKINQKREEIKKLEKKLEKFTEDKEKIISTKSKIKIEISKIENTIKQLQKDIDFLNYKQKLKESNIKKIQKDISDFQDKKLSLLKLTKEFLLNNYKDSFIKTADDLDFNYQKEIIKNSINYISKLTHSIDNLKNEEIKETLDKEKIVTEKEELSLLKDKTENAKEEKNNEIKRIIQKEEAIDEKINQIKENANTLKKLIDELISKKTEVEERRKESIATKMALEQKKFNFPWPLKGSVIQKYGKEMDKTLKTFIISTGIKIKGQETTVKAIEDGEVIFSDKFRTFGNLMIIQHSTTFHSIYANLKEFIVKEGEKIHAGDTIATINPNEYLYFEIRVDNIPVDPLEWLQKQPE